MSLRHFAHRVRSALNPQARARQLRARASDALAPEASRSEAARIRQCELWFEITFWVAGVGCVLLAQLPDVTSAEVLEWYNHC